MSDPNTEADEREHCHQAVVAHVLTMMNSTGADAWRMWADLLMRERAAVRAECQAEIERLNAECERLFQLCKVLGAQ